MEGLIFAEIRPYIWWTTSSQLGRPLQRLRRLPTHISLLGRKHTSDSGYFSFASENGFRVVSTLTMAAMAADAEPPPGADERDPRL